MEELGAHAFFYCLYVFFNKMDIIKTLFKTFANEVFKIKKIQIYSKNSILH